MKEMTTQEKAAIAAIASGEIPEMGDDLSDYLSRRSAILTKKYHGSIPLPSVGREKQVYNVGETVKTSKFSPQRGEFTIIDLWEDYGYWYYKATCGKCTSILRTKDIESIV
jgi:hypothetical protein